MQPHFWEQCYNEQGPVQLVYTAVAWPTLTDQISQFDGESEAIGDSGWRSVW